MNRFVHISVVYGAFWQTLPVKSFKLNIAKKEVEYFETSFKPYGLSCMSNPAFLNNVIDFGKFGKDKINEETIEFLVPYLEIEGFNPQAREGGWSTM